MANKNQESNKTGLQDKLDVYYNLMENITNAITQTKPIKLSHFTGQVT